MWYQSAKYLTTSLPANSCCLAMLTLEASWRANVTIMLLTLLIINSVKRNVSRNCDASSSGHSQDEARSQSKHSEKSLSECHLDVNVTPRPSKRHNATCRRPSRLAGKCKNEDMVVGDSAEVHVPWPSSQSWVWARSLCPLRLVSTSLTSSLQQPPSHVALLPTVRWRQGRWSGAARPLLPAPHSVYPPPTIPFLCTPLSLYLSRFPWKPELVRFWFPRARIKQTVQR